MNVTLSVMRADVGSAGAPFGSAPSVVRAVRDRLRRHGRGLLLEFAVSRTGEGVAALISHRRGVGDPRIHRLAHDAFLAAAREARAAAPWDAGPGTVDAAAGEDIVALGPPESVAELAIEERPAEPFVLLAADQAGPGAFNGALYLAFADPLNTPGLATAPRLGAGFRFVVVDVAPEAGGRTIELVTPAELYDLAALLRRPERYVVASVWSRATGEAAAAVAVAPLHGSAGRAAPDDPVALVRCGHPFPAASEVLAPFQLGHLVAGAGRSAAPRPLLPVPFAPDLGGSEGSPVVTAAAYTVRDGRLAGPVDAFAHPYWDAVRRRLADQAVELRRASARFGVPATAAGAIEPEVEERIRGLDGRFVAHGAEGAGGSAVDRATPAPAAR